MKRSIILVATLLSGCAGIGNQDSDFQDALQIENILHEPIYVQVHDLWTDRLADILIGGTFALDAPELIQPANRKHIDFADVLGFRTMPDELYGVTDTLVVNVSVASEHRVEGIDSLEYIFLPRARLLIPINRLKQNSVVKISEKLVSQE